MAKLTEVNHRFNSTAWNITGIYVAHDDSNSSVICEETILPTCWHVKKVPPCLYPSSMEDLAYTAAGTQLVISFVAIAINVVAWVGISRCKRIPFATRMILLNLTLCDFLFATIANPFFIHIQIRKAQGRTNCVTNVVFIGVTSLIYNTAFLSILLAATERYVAVFYPYKLRKWLHSQHVGVLLACVWMYGVTLASLTPSFHAKAISFHVNTAVIYSGTIAIGVMYCRMLCLAVQMRRRDVKYTPQLSRKRKVAQMGGAQSRLKLVGGLVALEMVCSLPLLVLIQYVYAGNEEVPIAFVACFTFFGLHSCLDPLCYCICDRNIRASMYAVIRQMPGAKWCCCWANEMRMRREFSIVVPPNTPRLQKAAFTFEHGERTSSNGSSSIAAPPNT